LPLAKVIFQGAKISKNRKQKNRILKRSEKHEGGTVIEQK
jgi:hypothetical protein